MLVHIHQTCMKTCGHPFQRIYYLPYEILEQAFEDFTQQQSQNTPAKAFCFHFPLSLSKVQRESDSQLKLAVGLLGCPHFTQLATFSFWPMKDPFLFIVYHMVWGNFWPNLCSRLQFCPIFLVSLQCHTKDFINFSVWRTVGIICFLGVIMYL